MSGRAEMWKEPCAAARDIRARFGVRKALGYILGEKFFAFLEAADRHPELAGDIPEFAAEIHRIFTREAIEAYLGSASRFGPLGHTLTSEEHALWRQEGVVEEDIVTDAEEAILVERARRILLD